MQNNNKEKEYRMKITIFGSTGFLGSVLLEKALEAGYQIKTLVRNPDKLGVYKDKIEFVQGSVFTVEDIEKTVEGTEVVISTVGPPQRKPGDPKIYEKAMQNIVSVLEKHKIKRYIHTGGAVHAGGEDENWTFGRRLLWLFLRILVNPILIAKHLEWEVLKRSNLDWTLVRPPQITKSGRTGNVKAEEKNLARTKINVEDLAGFMTEQINSKEWIRKAPLTSSVKQN